MIHNILYFAAAGIGIPSYLLSEHGPLKGQQWLNIPFTAGVICVVYGIYLQFGGYC